MTRDETKKLLMIIQAAYPNFNPPDKNIAVDTWYLMLKDYSYAQVEAAVSAYIRTDTKGFPPSIGQIVEKLQILFGGTEINEMAAWGMVLKAIRNSGYHAEEEFAKLPDVIQKTIGGPSQLKEWALMEDPDGTGLNVIQSHFSRAYRQEATRAKELSKMDPKLLQLVQGTAELLTYQPKKEIPEKTSMEEWQPLSEQAQEKIKKAKEKLGGAHGGG